MWIPWASPKRIEGPDGRNLQLHFRSRLSLPLFTGGKVEGEQGAAIHIVLLDVNTGHVVTSGPESTIKLDVVVLEGDFNNEDDEGWTEEEFESHVVKEREGKRPLLTGDLQVTLKEGVGTLGELTFTDNSSWIRSRKFRLGLKVASGFCEGIRVNDDRIILDKTLTDQVSIWKSSRGLTDKVVLDHDCSGETCTYYQIGDVFVCEKTGL
ncbi:calmodulin-binding protein 60 D-like [Camellia sinensis]|uniref:calmodulin-binding protein 60 D-like n=1 Tax=Camellia sinensis TaxID=4442 RepID=UPI001035BE87|nr:calmodulin-binding protein 60 D-like [Camellia sinensis]